MDRVYNFSAGPAMLPLEVLEQARDELLNWNNTGMSAMEISHRSEEFKSLAEKTETDIRKILSIPEEYKVLFMQGGATGQFSMVPMNLLKGKGKADYILTGHWSNKAIKEAEKYCTVNVAASSEMTHFTTIPPQSAWKLDSSAAYVHYTANETIHGAEFQWIPETEDAPLVSDMSSNMLSRPVDVNKFGLIYACSQKNFGPAGITMVILREDLIGGAMPQTPLMFDYEIHAKKNSLYNTPVTYSWYICGLVFDWIKKQGGLEKLAKKNKQKSDKLYLAIDNSDFYNNPVDQQARSWMNIPFTMKDSSLEQKFLDDAKAAGLVALKGHRSIGGLRASLYNGMPEEGVDKLIEFMSEFEGKNS